MYYSNSATKQFKSRDSSKPAKTTYSQKVQPKMANFVTLQRKCTPGRAETITSLITKIVALDMVPEYTMDEKGFRKLMDFLEPEYKVPFHQTAMQRINKMYGEVENLGRTK